MKKSTTIPFILQSILTQEEVESVVKWVGYEDKARKFTVYHLLKYWCMAACEEWSGYRFGADRAAASGLPEVHYLVFQVKRLKCRLPYSRSSFICSFVNAIVKHAENWLFLKSCYLLIPRQ